MIGSKLKYLGIGFIVALMVSAGVGYLLYERYLSQKPPAPAVASFSPADRHKLNKKALVQYVIRESGGRMSDQMASEFVDSVLVTRFPLLILAIGKVESHYDITAKSHRGAWGIFQIRPRIWGKELKAAGIIKNNRDLFDYRISPKACEYVLTRLYEKKGGLYKALNAYVGGQNKYPMKVLSSLGELYIIGQEPISDVIDTAVDTVNQ